MIQQTPEFKVAVAEIYAQLKELIQDEHLVDTASGTPTHSRRAIVV